MYEQYFNEEYTNKAINFLKETQKEITHTLNNKNIKIFSHIIFCIIICIIYLVSIIFKIKDIFKILK